MSVEEALTLLVLVLIGSIVLLIISVWLDDK